MKIEDKTGTPIRMKMEELCKVAKLSRSTIYQYLRSGILHPPIKEGHTQLRYDETHLKQLKKIRNLREQEKLSIPDIQKMIQNEELPGMSTNEKPSDLKALIIEKALELYSKNGFAKTKVTDLTDALQLGKGTFYLYFKSKEELFLECIERVPEIILPIHVWEEIRKDRNYFGRTHSRLRFMLETFPMFMGIISIAKLALRGSDAMLAKKATECFQTITRALIKDINRAIQNKVIRKVDQKFIAFILFGIGESAGYWLRINPEYPLEKTLDNIMDFLSHGLMRQNPNSDDKSKHFLSAKIEDLSGSDIQLQRIRFNNMTYIEGKLGDGKFQIDPKEFGSIKIDKKKQNYSATVTMKSGKRITVHIDESVILSGQSTFGHYLIPLSNVIELL